MIFVLLWILFVYAMAGIGTMLMMEEMDYEFTERARLIDRCWFIATWPILFFAHWWEDRRNNS